MGPDVITTSSATMQSAGTINLDNITIDEDDGPEIDLGSLEDGYYEDGCNCSVCTAMREVLGNNSERDKLKELAEKYDDEELI